MNTEKETLSTEKEDPIAEEETPLKELVEEISYPKFKISCSPKGTLKQRLLMEKVLTGLYVHLCSDCRRRVRDGITELSLANAEEVFNGLDIKIHPPDEVWE